MSLLRSLLFFLAAAVAAALAVLCLWVDIRVFGNDIPEVSLTEVVQESVLAVIVLVHLLLARKYAHLRYSNILIGGFFLAMLIRELDGLFDLLSHGSWVWFALLATAGSLLLPLRHLRQTLSQLAEELGESVENITLAIQAAQPAVSLTPENREESDRQMDIPVASPEEELADKIGLAEVLRGLPEEDRRIIQLRFYGGKTQSDTAKLLHTTQVQISRRERKILKVMRDRLLEEG